MSKRSFAIWTAYWAIWAFFGLVEFYTVRSTQHIPTLHAAIGAIWVVLPGSTLGVGVWRMTRWIHAQEGRTKIATLHVVGASLYTFVWAGVILWAMSRPMGFAAAWASFSTFALWQLILGLIVYGIIGSISYAARVFLRLREEEQRTARAETLRVRAELEALRGKLQPHFLFNTLHTITALVRSDPVAAEEALLKLGDLLRYVLKLKSDEQTDDVPLSQEIAFLEKYLAIEKIRLGDRLRVDIDVTEEASVCAVPTFTLQPLVENAIQHAIAPRAKGGWVRVAAATKDGRLRIEIEDDGPGASLAEVEKSSGFGLRTVRQRIATRFGSAAETTVRAEPGKGFALVMTLPIEEASDV